MPRVAENLPTALRSILENENFIQMENQAIRAIMDEPHAQKQLAS
jgi:regulator of replication initiation timing